jgi:hypothetical protein
MRDRQNSQKPSGHSPLWLPNIACHLSTVSNSLSLTPTWLHRSGESWYMDIPAWSRTPELAVQLLARSECSASNKCLASKLITVVTYDVFLKISNYFVIYILLRLTWVIMQIPSAVGQIYILDNISRPTFRQSSTNDSMYRHSKRSVCTNVCDSAHNEINKLWRVCWQIISDT